ncbi:CLUMA_CG002897, isoform A [Clunio marinus]|uniref:CLUMA_CG002897, isoform A n=1 Tax=Clunio marinus TaxID=568069 RepID=A0A1J1HM34_9DIPT|nr:CLUMA_CG002897, isoform A [Clunio marinus]
MKSPKDIVEEIPLRILNIVPHICCKLRPVDTQFHTIRHKCDLPSESCGNESLPDNDFFQAITITQ